MVPNQDCHAHISRSPGHTICDNSHPKLNTGYSKTNKTKDYFLFFWNPASHRSTVRQITATLDSQKKQGTGHAPLSRASKTKIWAARKLKVVRRWMHFGRSILGCSESSTKDLVRLAENTKKELINEEHDRVVLQHCTRIQIGRAHV